MNITAHNEKMTVEGIRKTSNHFASFKQAPAQDAIDVILSSTNLTTFQKHALIMNIKSQEAK